MVVKYTLTLKISACFGKSYVEISRKVMHLNDLPQRGPAVIIPRRKME
jgi:hypothetical protein